MVKYISQAITVILLFLSNVVSAQNTSLDQTLNTLQKQAIDYPFEKVHLHLDKPYYVAGDTIWFKGYVVIGAGHYLSGCSSVLNVDLIDGQNEIIKSIKLPLIGGVTRGEFALGDNTTEGSYRIRAFTNWMRNAGPEYFFDKTITIFNAVSNKVFVRSNCTYSLNNNQQTVNYTINYTDLAGKPYANKEVKYDVQLDPKRISKGKSITDERGNLQVSFINPPLGILSTGKILTSIQIDNQQAVAKAVVIKATTSKVNVQFFPEGGNLVNGITSKVAFKAVSANGLGADIKGTVTDEQNNEVAAIITTHLGMGTFMLTPQAGQSYKANITYADGTQNLISLPQAIKKGYVLAIDGQTDSLNLIVKITSDETQDGLVTLVAQSGGDVYLQGKGKPGKKSFTAIIPKAKLPSGVIQFTLFSNAGEPLNERLVFIQNPDQLKLTISTERLTYSARQKVKINLEAKSSEGAPVQGNFSVAVIDETKMPIDENIENSIISNILLTSDIKGYIEQPNYYFAHTTNQTKADLDVLMLTQGYHRFEWKKIMNGIIPDFFYQPEKSIQIAGLLKNLNGKPLPNTNVTLLNNSGVVFAMDTVTDKSGRFVFNLDFKDSSKFTIKAASVNRGDVKVELDNTRPAANINKNVADIQVTINNGMQAYLQNSKNKHDVEVKYHIGDHSALLKQVDIKATRPKTEKELKIERAVEFSSNLNGKGNADQVITSEAFEGMGCARAVDCLEGKLVGVIFDKLGNPYLFRAPINPNTHVKAAMGIVVDGVFTDGGINSIDNLEDISSIEVLSKGYYTAIYGTRAAGGILVITTKHGSGFVEDLKNDPGVIRPKGYYKAREFYSPQYDNPKTNTEIADLRTTIFWKPIIQTDKNGNASFEYFNAGSKGTYRVVVEGIDYNGNLGGRVCRYKVE